MEVEDLDILRPEPRVIRIGAKDVDVSFIPCGITFEVDTMMRELNAIDREKLMENGEETKKAFDISIKMCALFCARKYPEMNYEWFCDNADAGQIQAFSAAIRDALTRAYKGASTKN